MENQKTNYGWVCPVCGHVYAPYMPGCTNCNSKLNANNNKWVLKQIGDTLRQCWNEINHDTCLGRNINQSRVFIKKLIEGEKRLLVMKDLKITIENEHSRMHLNSPGIYIDYNRSEKEKSTPSYH